MLALGPIGILALGALVVWALSGRVRSMALGIGAALGSALALGWLAAMQRLGASTALPWAVVDGHALELSVAAGDALLLGGLLLLCGATTAGALAWNFGRAGRDFGMLYCGLLMLLAGGLLTVMSASTPAALLGVGVAWWGGTIMQQATAVHHDDTRLAGLGVVVLALALLGSAAAPELDGAPLADVPWLAGCCVLIALGPVWGTTPAAPLLVRAPVVALGAPALGGVLLLRHGLLTAASWSDRTTAALLVFGVAATLLGALNALVSVRLGDMFGWQTTALLGGVALVWGTGRPEAGPMAAGLLTHTLVVGTAAALSVGLLERATGDEAIATLPPPPRPLLLAGLAYAIAAASAVGLPPLLGYSLRRVVLVLGELSQPWLPPLLLAGSTLLALSYLPTLAALFRRPSATPTRDVAAPRGGSWPLLLMLGLVAGGLVPQTLWQRALGDPAAAQAGWPPLAALLSAALPAVLLLILLAAGAVWLRRARPPTAFAGGERPEETGWALPFAALRRAVWPLAAPAQLPSLPPQLREQGVRLSGMRRALERRYYLLIVVGGLLVVLLLAVQ